MAEVVIHVPAQLKKEIKKFDQFTLSIAFQKALLEMLVSKSRLTKRDAGKIAKKMELGMADELKHHNLA